MVGSDFCPGFQESNQQRLTSKQTTPARGPQRYLEPIFVASAALRGILGCLAIMLGPPSLYGSSFTRFCFLFFLPDFGYGKRHDSDKFC